jgi:hypothetical protein
VANYAVALLDKFKRLSGASDKAEPSLKFQNFEMDPFVVSLEEVLFVRILYECAKWSNKDRSPSFS